MSLHVLANHMATKGRGPDSMLVHMTPEEVASLQALAMKNGGSLTINPDTGLPEAGFLKKLLPAIAGFALNAFLPGVGTAIGGALGTSAAVGTGIAVGGITGLATGSLSKGLMAGLGAYGGAGLADSFMGAGAASGLNSALANAGTAEGAQGQAFNEFLKSEANPAVMSSTDKLAAGFNAVKEAPGAFLKDNWKMGLAAASPFLADAMVPTTVKAPDDKATGYIRPFQFDENTRTVRAMDPVLASEWGARQFPDYIRKGQIAPPAGMAPQRPPGMATGGIVALADGGETDPYARFNTLSGQSKDAYDFLMGNIQRVPAADLTTPTRPVVSNTNTTSTTGGGGSTVTGGTSVGDSPLPIMPSPDDSYGSDFAPANPSDFGAVEYGSDFEPANPSDFGAVNDGYGSDFAPANPSDFGAVDYGSDFAPANPSDFGAVDTAPAPAPADASYWSDSGQDEVGPSVGLMKNQEDLPEELDKYLAGSTPYTEPALDPNFFEPAYGNTGVSEPTEYEVQPWENLDNSGYYTGSTNPYYNGYTYDTSSIDNVKGYYGSSNDGGYCPAPWINILLADGGTVKAGDIKPGMEVYTRHETTNEWGVYPVSAVEMSEDTRWEVLLEDGRSFVGSANHRVHTGDDWTEIHALKAGDKLVQPEGFGVVKSSAKLDHGPVVKITVAGAHTYISEGFLSHNVKMIDFDGFGGGGGGGGVNRYFDAIEYVSAVANGGLIDSYADGGVSGSGSLDLSIPINVGGAGGGGGMGGGFNGGYTPAGSNGSAGNMNPNTGGGGLSGIAGLFGGINGQQSARQPMPLPAQMRNPYSLPAGQEEITWGVPGSSTYGSTNPDWERAAAWNRDNQPSPSFYDFFGNAQQDEHVMQPRQPQGNLPVGYGEVSGGSGFNGQYFAAGGAIPGYALGGLGALGGYSDGGRLLKGPGDGVSDSIPATIGRNKQPARLADGEFVVPARIVSELGNGSTEAGARKLYAMMDRIQKARGKTVGKGKVAANSRSDKHLPA